MLTLYHSPGTRSMRVRWLCEEMGVPLDVKTNAFRNPDAAFQAVSVMGTVPVLVDGDLVMSESIAMMLYIADKYGPTDLKLAPSEPEFGRMLNWLMFAEGAIGGYINPILRARFFGPEDAGAAWSVADSAAKCEKALSVLADALNGRDHIAGGRFTMADIALAHAIGVARRVLPSGDAVADHVVAYQERLFERPAYQRAAA
ncbi:MAG: glutathione S-transferase family protein [Alphaproteobacteria bacterium]|nr:glutathione S-transferase family protein [Alphaproteobacteria bacterium]